MSLKQMLGGWFAGDPQRTGHDVWTDAGRRAGDYLGGAAGALVGKIPMFGAATPFLRDVGAHLGAALADEFWTPEAEAAAQRMAATRRWIERRNAALSKGLPDPNAGGPRYTA